MHTENQTPEPRGGRLIAGVREGLERFASRRLVLVIFALLVFGAGVGYGVSKLGIVHELRLSVLEPLVLRVRHAINGGHETSEWELYETHLGPFEKVHLSVADRDGGPMAALEELDGHLVFMAQSGHLTELSPGHTLRDLDIDVPMHTEELRAANIEHLDFLHFRALDLLAVSAGEHAYDLYASYDRYHPDRRCFDLVVSRIRLTVAEAELTPQTGWEEIYATTPCVAPRNAISQFTSAFVGIQSGGRLALRDPHTLLFSVGDLEFDGVMYEGLTEAPNGPQDPAWDLGKVLEINLDTRRARHFAMGFRNPQGLLIDSTGRVWETEHGPYGGDEINVLHAGGNYGWPNVTYGMRYVPRGDNWPLNPTHGGHEGYDRPSYVFVPSIGISQLIQPNPETFPFWDHSLLVTSLRGRALYALRVEGDHVVYAEPLPMGERLRDIINRSNGEIAILTDIGNLVLMRPQTDPNRERSFSIADARGHDSPVTPAESGRRVFAANCQSCHSVNGQASMGPPLNGVYRRDIASLDFNYSAALRNAPGTWTHAQLMNWLTDAQSPYPGSAMPPPHLTREQARDVIAYLRTTQ